MGPFEYVESISSFKRIGEKPDGRLCYKPVSSLTVESVRELLTGLPWNGQICYADPDIPAPGGELTYVWIRRADTRYFVMTASHGVWGKWRKEPFEEVLAAFFNSRLMQKPLEKFESFQFGPIPKHQQNDHLQ
jgi:hypothetical protein